MPRPDPPDEQVTARLAGLDLAIGGWVPAQPDLVDAGPAEAPPVETDPVRSRREPARGTDRPPVMAGAVAARPLPHWVPGWAHDLTAATSPTALVTLAAVCAGCVVVTGYLLLHRPTAPVADTFPLAPAPAITATPTVAGIVVDVGGRVRRPGLVTLPAGARVADALHAAGGALRHRDVATLNLAARVADGQLLLVGSSGAAPVAAGTGATGADGAASAAPVNLNTATLEQLDTLPGIGPVLAQRILDWRAAHGGFGSVTDLDEVSGIGDSTFADLSPLVTV
jgi:competence protein ComEA